MSRMSRNTKNIVDTKFIISQLISKNIFLFCFKFDHVRRLKYEKKKYSNIVFLFLSD